MKDLLHRTGEQMQHMESRAKGVERRVEDLLLRTKMRMEQVEGQISDGGNGLINKMKKVGLMKVVSAPKTCPRYSDEVWNRGVPVKGASGGFDGTRTGGRTGGEMAKTIGMMKAAKMMGMMTKK